jgi:hypothetical protein
MQGAVGLLAKRVAGVGSPFKVVVVVVIQRESPFVLLVVC